MRKLLLFLIISFEIFANERIISLSPAITEILFGLNRGKDVIAVTKFSNYPKEAQKLPIIGNYVSIDIEKILALIPTVVVAQQFQKSFAQKLQKLGVKVLFVKLNTIANIEESIISLGKHLKSEKEAKELIDSIERAKKRAKHSKKKKRVLIVFTLKESLKNDKNTQTPATFTFSCGVAEYQEGDTLDDLLQKADKALYSAKETRDRVILST